MFVTIEVLAQHDDEPGRYSTAVSYTEGLSDEQVCMILAATLLALEPKGEMHGQT